MRLIDADAFIEENKEIIDCEIDHPKYQDTIRELIDEAPTIKTFTLADIEEQYRKGMEKGLEEAERPHGEWKYHKYDKDYECSICNTRYDAFDLPVKTWDYCPNCGASMQANDRQVTGKLNSEIEAKVKELEDAIARCERAEKEFASRTCKFRSPRNCDFCAFHSDCDEHLEEGETE